MRREAPSLAQAPTQDPDALQVRSSDHPKGQAMTQSRADRDAELWAFDQMSHEAAQNRTESDARPEAGPVSDRDAQDAREARYAEAIWGKGSRSRLRARAVAAVADAELAPLVARVAELEAERDAARNAHARAIVQLSEWMERAERAEADLVNAWLAIEDVADEVDRRGSLADYIHTLAAAGPAVSDRPAHDRLAAAGADLVEVDPPAVSDGEGATSEATCSCGGTLLPETWRGVEHMICGECSECSICDESARPASPVVAPSATDEAPICAKDVGDPPEVCRCLLPRGHAGLHLCKHKTPAPDAVPSSEATDGTTPTKEA